ncbi:MAG: fimbrial protein [Desulfuromonas sp.]|nr:MAG: fimbrial protein [Desulfuromonas sp.]
MIRINLLPVKAAQKKEKLIEQLVLLAVVVGVVIVVCSGAYASLQGKISAVNDEISAKEAEINQLRRTIGEVDQFKKLQKELRSKLDVLDQLKMGKAGPVHLLDELSQALPEKAWIVSFSEGGGRVAISGMAHDEPSVAEFLQNLESSPYYRDVELLVIEQQDRGALKLQKFDVGCLTETPPTDM